MAACLHASTSEPIPPHFIHVRDALITPESHHSHAFLLCFTAASAVLTASPGTVMGARPEAPKFLTKQVKTFLLGTTHRRSKIINDTIATAVVYHLTAAGKLAVIFLAKEEDLDDDESDDVRVYFLGSSSNLLAGSLRPAAVPRVIAGSILTILLESAIPASDEVLGPIAELFKIGAPFNGDQFGFLAEHTPDASLSYVVVLSPASLIATYQSAIYRGTIDENAYSVLGRTHGAVGRVWLDAVAGHNPDVQTLLLANAAEMGAHLPSKRQQQVWCPTSRFNATESADLFDDTTHGINALSKRISALLDPTGSEDDTPPAEGSVGIPTNVNANNGLADTPATGTTPSKNESRDSRLFLFWAGVGEDGNVCPPVPHEDGLEILALTDTREANGQYLSSLTRTAEVVNDSDHYIFKAAVTNGFTEYLAACLLRVEIRPEPLTNVREATALRGWNIMLLFGPTRGAATSSIDGNTIVRTAEDLMGASDEHRTKALAKLDPVLYIDGIIGATAMCGNALIPYLGLFTLAQGEGAVQPTLIACAIKISDCINKSNIRRWLRANPEIARWFGWYVALAYERVWLLCYEAAADPSNARSALKGSWPAVDPSYYREAEELTDDFVKAVRSAARGGAAPGIGALCKTCPDYLLYTKAAEAKREEAIFAKFAAKYGHKRPSDGKQSGTYCCPFSPLAHPVLTFFSALPSQALPRRRQPAPTSSLTSRETSPTPFLPRRTTATCPWPSSPTPTSSPARPTSASVATARSRAASTPTSASPNAPSRPRPNGSPTSRPPPA